MKPQHRSLLAIVLSIVVIIVWYAFFSPKRPQPSAAKMPQQEVKTPPEKTSATAENEKPAEEPSQETAEKSRDPQGDIPQVESIVENDRIKAVFSNKGGVPLSWKLKGYNESSEKDSPLIDLAPQEKGLAPAMRLSFRDAGFSFPEHPTYRLVSAENSKLVYEWKSNEVVVRKTISVSPDNYIADVDVAVQNLTERPIAATPVLTMSGTSLPAKKKGFFSFLKQPPVTNSSPVYYMDGKVHREKKIQKLPAAQVIASDPQKGGGLYWAGLEERYFLSAVIPRTISTGVSAVVGASQLETQTGAWGMYAGSALAPVNVLPKGVSEMKFTVYAGPKEINDLKAVDVHLDEAINYGWFTIIAIPILYLLKMFYTVVRNYGIAIILLTVVIKLILHPINTKSMKSMKAMQKLQPKLKELQAKYKGDKQRLNMETMQLFRAHKVNPMGGCLPMLLQFPVYIALYKVLWNSIELYHAPFFWFYNDLSAPDPYMITPILLGIGMLFQQRVMPSATADPTQRKMMMIMPIMFTVFMIFLPVGLVVYILVNTVVSVAQQYMYNKGIRMRDVLRFKFKPSTIN